MFKGNKKVNISASIKQKITFITPKIEVTGNFHGEGAVQIEGTLHGDINVTSVVIGEYGTVNGIINAKNVIINGKLNGAVFCNSLEIMKNGSVNANTIKSKNIIVDGVFKGNLIASELLEIGSNGSVEGKITVKNIKTQEGGKLLGSMQIYEEKSKA